MHIESLELTVSFGEYWLMMTFKTQTVSQALNHCCGLIDLHFTSLLKTIGIDPNAQYTTRINKNFLKPPKTFLNKHWHKMIL